jgi:H+/Cl- antiporter ClcA
MVPYLSFVVGAIIFFTVGVIFTYFDELYQEYFNETSQDNDAGRGFYVALSLVVLAITALILIHYLFVLPKEEEEKIEPSGQFINVGGHKKQKVSEEALTGDLISTEGITIGS